MKTIILSVGDELTTGQTVDTNTAWLARQVSAEGGRVERHLTVADDRTVIAEAIREAAGMADLLLITGGLGPTDDDLTRQGLADVLEVDLVRDEASVVQIEAFFTARGRTMPPANVVQAMVPVGCTALTNSCGTAPGIAARVGNANVYCMPGVPREMRVMYEQHVRPAIQQGGGGAAMLHRVLRCYGAGESDIGLAIRDLMQRGRNPAVGTTAKLGVIGVRIYARGQSPAHAQQLLAETEAEVRRRLGDLIFGVDEQTLAEAVGGHLRARGQSVAVAESCTGGLLAKLLTDIPGSSDYFLEGVVSYANAAKTRLLGVPAELIERHGAVSEPVARAMAVGMRERAQCTYALSLTGIAGPGGGTADKPVGLVYIGLAHPAGAAVSEHRFGDSYTRDEIRERAAATALNRLRRCLLDAT